MDKLTEEEVLYVANLAKLNISDDEINDYRICLSAILNEINNINELEINDGDTVIAPTTNENMYKEDTEGKMLSKEEIFKNAKNTSGSYISVPKVLND